MLVRHLAHPLPPGACARAARSPPAILLVCFQHTGTRAADLPVAGGRVFLKDLLYFNPTLLVLGVSADALGASIAGAWYIRKLHTVGRM